MRKLIFATTSLPALVLGTSVMAASPNCDDGWTALNDSYQSASSDGSMAAIQGDMRSLKRAAMTLNKAGYTDACESIVEAMKDMAENEEPRMKFTDASLEYREQNGAEMQDRDVPEWKMDLEQAVEYSETKVVSAADLEDMDVHSSTSGYDIGAVDRVLERDGKPAFIVLGHGGFLGIGDKEVVIPLEKTKFSTETETMYIPVTDAMLEKAPDFDMDAYEADPKAYLTRADDSWMK